MAAFCRILPGLCPVERGGGIHYPARLHCKDTVRLLAAGAAGFPLRKTYLKIMNRFAEQFGLTPSSRSRIIAEDNSGGTIDEMEALLGGCS